MKATKQKINVEIFILTFQNNYDTGISELSIFSEIIKKISQESKKAGYKKLFTLEERNFLDEIYSQLVPDNKAPNIQEFQKINLERKDEFYNEEQLEEGI